MLGLYSTVYSVGGILAGWFLAGPIVSLRSLVGIYQPLSEL